MTGNGEIPRQAAATGRLSAGAAAQQAAAARGLSTGDRLAALLRHVAQEIRTHSTHSSRGPPRPSLRVGNYIRSISFSPHLRSCRRCRWRLRFANRVQGSVRHFSRRLAVVRAEQRRYQREYNERARTVSPQRPGATAGAAAGSAGLKQRDSAQGGAAAGGDSDDQYYTTDAEQSDDGSRSSTVSSSDDDSTTSSSSSPSTSSSSTGSSSETDSSGTPPSAASLTEDGDSGSGKSTLRSVEEGLGSMAERLGATNERPSVTPGHRKKKQRDDKQTRAPSKQSGAKKLSMKDGETVKGKKKSVGGKSTNTTKPQQTRKGSAKTGGGKKAKGTESGKNGGTTSSGADDSIQSISEKSAKDRSTNGDQKGESEVTIEASSDSYGDYGENYLSDSEQDDAVDINDAKVRHKTGHRAVKKRKERSKAGGRETDSDSNEDETDTTEEETEEEFSYEDEEESSDEMDDFDSDILNEFAADEDLMDEYFTRKKKKKLKKDDEKTGAKRKPDIKKKKHDKRQGRSSNVSDDRHQENQDSDRRRKHDADIDIIRSKIVDRKEKPKRSIEEEVIEYEYLYTDSPEQDGKSSERISDNEEKERVRRDDRNRSKSDRKKDRKKRADKGIRGHKNEKFQLLQDDHDSGTERTNTNTRRRKDDSKKNGQKRRSKQSDEQSSIGLSYSYYDLDSDSATKQAAEAGRRNRSGRKSKRKGHLSKRSKRGIRSEDSVDEQRLEEGLIDEETSSQDTIQDGKIAVKSHKKKKKHRSEKREAKLKNQKEGQTASPKQSVEDNGALIAETDKKRGKHRSKSSARKEKRKDHEEMDGERKEKNKDKKVKDKNRAGTKSPHDDLSQEIVVSEKGKKGKMKIEADGKENISTAMKDVKSGAKKDKGKVNDKIIADEDGRAKSRKKRGKSAGKSASNSSVDPAYLEISSSVNRLREKCSTLCAHGSSSLSRSLPPRARKRSKAKSAGSRRAGRASEKTTSSAGGEQKEKLSPEMARAAAKQAAMVRQAREKIANTGWKNDKDPSKRWAKDIMSKARWTSGEPLSSEERLVEKAMVYKEDAQKPPVVGLSVYHDKNFETRPWAEIKMMMKPPEREEKAKSSRKRSASPDDGRKGGKKKQKRDLLASTKPKKRKVKKRRVVRPSWEHRCTVLAYEVDRLQRTRVIYREIYATLLERQRELALLRSVQDARTFDKVDQLTARTGQLNNWGALFSERQIPGGFCRGMSVYQGCVTLLAGRRWHIITLKRQLARLQENLSQMEGEINALFQFKREQLPAQNSTISRLQRDLEQVEEKYTNDKAAIFASAAALQTVMQNERRRRAPLVVQQAIDDVVESNSSWQQVEKWQHCLQHWIQRYQQHNSTLQVGIEQCRRSQQGRGSVQRTWKHWLLTGRTDELTTEG